MNFKEFLLESSQSVSEKDRKIAEDIENSLKKTLTQKFLDDILNNAIKDKVISKTSTSLKKFGESHIKLTRLVATPVGANIGLEGSISVDVEVSSLQSPDKSIIRNDSDFKSIESKRKNIRSQVTNELAKALRKQVSSQVKRIAEVSKRAYAESISITLTYE